MEDERGLRQRLADLPRAERIGVVSFLGLLVAASGLAAPAADGTQVAVPRKGETLAGSGATGGVATAVADDGRVNLNTADLAELETLPRVGEVLAQRIIDYRTANGPFASVDDLLDVSGIGDATLEGFRDLVTV